MSNTETDLSSGLSFEDQNDSTEQIHFSSKVVRQEDGRFRAEATSLPGVSPQFAANRVDAMDRLTREVHKQWQLGKARPKVKLRGW